MKTPPLLIGAALLFWGWQADFLIVGALMALVLEGARFVETRWDLNDDDFSRIWTFCAVLFLATLAYAFTSNDGPSTMAGMLGGDATHVAQNLGAASTKTAVLMIRWLPLVFFLFIAAQCFSHRQGIPLETISLILRRRWKKLKQAGRALPPSRVVNVAWPYFILCLFAASSHPTTNYTFFGGLCFLTAWALWGFRSPRFGLAAWVGALAAAGVLGWVGQRGLIQANLWIAQYNGQWLARFMRQGFDPSQSLTSIGQIGQIKTSGQIVIRLETPPGHDAPSYLREASYRVYKTAAWFAGSSKDDFTPVTEETPYSGKWQMVPDTTNPARLNIACYVHGGKSLVPLPTDAGRLEHFPAYIVQKNGVGSVLAEGPGFVMFDALYGSGAAMDLPPNTNEDLFVPMPERRALTNIIASLHLEGQDQTRKIMALSQFFESKFTYSLWQEKSKNHSTNNTPLSRFLEETHSGHCEYFATATVLLLRELGIPARYTIGYYVHEHSGRNYVVRQRDAHAWVRLWDDQKKQWRDFDTTPASSLETEAAQASALQFLSDCWSRLVYEFSKFRWGQGNIRQYILWGLVPVLALLLYQIIFRTRKRKAQGRKGQNHLPTDWPGLDSEFYKLETELGQRGYTRQPGELVSDWLSRAAADARHANLSVPFREILRLHYRHRFDPLGLAADDREALRRKVAGILSGTKMTKV